VARGAVILCRVAACLFSDHPGTEIIFSRSCAVLILSAIATRKSPHGRGAKYFFIFKLTLVRLLQLTSLLLFTLGRERAFLHLIFVEPIFRRILFFANETEHLSCYPKSKKREARAKAACHYRLKRSA